MKRLALAGVLAGAIAATAVLLRPSAPPAAEPLPAGRAALETSPGIWRVARWAREDYFSDPARVNREVRLRPTPGTEPDSLTDLRVESLSPESPVWAAGLRPQDRILQINGTPVRTLSRAVNLVREIRDAPRVTLRVERDGRILDFRFDFP